ncbi:MAG: type II toxin-antitoxin system VapC family toxin [Candidatus Heimdallarchaeota archaeon]|nr:type II toxin-antitoxin system VapC family toxin [Candidatus Heimdallarchaeota archaeon]
MAIFLDTGFYIAFYNEEDKFHERAMEIYQLLRQNTYGKAYTSLDVLDELFTFLQRKNMKYLADSIIEDWFEKHKQIGKVIFASTEVLNQASSIFKSQSNERKGLSFTDCLIIGNCKTMGISNIATFEQGFHNYLQVIQ